MIKYISDIINVLVSSKKLEKGGDASEADLARASRLLFDL